MSLLFKFRSKLQREGLAAAMHTAARWLARSVGVPYGVEPYEYIQKHAEHHLHRYLGCGLAEVRHIVTVGAHLGFEVDSMLRRYPNVDFRLFEASPRYISALRRRFQSKVRVKIYDCAVADQNGSLTFYETNLSGSGSLLKVGEMAQQSYGMQQSESYTVVATRLDDHARENGYSTDSIDCLWIDVQGAELGVLKGAQELLLRVRSVFVEVSAYRPLYEGGATLADLQAILVPAGLSMVGLGTDPVNGTGNAMFVRDPKKTVTAHIAGPTIS